jgi:chromosome segregation ATPase
MTEERFDRIDRRFDGIDQRFDRVDERLNRVDHRLDQVDESLNRIDRRFDRVDERVDTLESGQAELQGETTRLSTEMAAFRTHVDARFEELGRHMRVLHEDALDRIAAVAEHTMAMSARMDQRFDEVLEAIGRRLDPLDATVRDHSARIGRLEQERG